MPNGKILLVEDDVMNMRLAQHVLEVEGYTVLRATTAQEALDKIAQVTEMEVWPEELPHFI